MILFVALLSSSASAAPSVFAAPQLQTNSPGALDGLAVGLYLPVQGPFGVVVHGSARTSAAGWDSDDEDALLRSSLDAGDGAADSVGVGADVWSAGTHVDLRLPVEAIGVHLQAGWSVRGQASAELAIEGEEFALRDDGTQGGVALRPANPSLGVVLGVPLAGPIGLRASVHQVLPLSDGLQEPLPGFTVATLGVQFALGSGGQKKVGSSNSGAEGDSDGDSGPMEDTGIEPVDVVFRKVQGLRDELGGLRDALRTARGDVEQLAATLGAGSFEELVARLRSGEVSVALNVSIEGGRPSVAPAVDATGAAAEVAGALQGLADAAAEVQARAPAIAEEAKALAEETQALLQSAPSLAKESGLPPTKIPGALKTLKRNVRGTVALPGELTATLDEAGQTVALLTSLTGGGQ